MDRDILVFLRLSQRIRDSNLFFESGLWLYDCCTRQCLTNQRDWKLGDIGSRLGSWFFDGRAFQREVNRHRVRCSRCDFCSLCDDGLYRLGDPNPIQERTMKPFFYFPEDKEGLPQLMTRIPGLFQRYPQLALWLTFRFEAFKGFNLKLSSFTSFLI